jgi:hypothetical protein
MKEKKKTSKNKSNVLFPKFNDIFLKSSRSYYDCFVNLEKKDKYNSENSIKSEDDYLYENNVITNGKLSTKSNNNNFKLKFDFKNDNNNEGNAEISFKPSIVKKIEIPSLKLGIKHKILNEGNEMR